MPNFALQRPGAHAARPGRGRGIGEVRFGATAHLVIHPGVVHEVTAVSGKLPAASNSLGDLVVHYAISAEDIRMQSGVLRIPETEIVSALRGASA